MSYRISTHIYHNEIMWSDTAAVTKLELATNSNPIEFAFYMLQILPSQDTRLSVIIVHEILTIKKLPDEMCIWR